MGGTRQWCQQGQNFPREISVQAWEKRCILCIQGCCLGSHMRAGAVTFSVARVSTCCTRTSGWASCRCRLWCRVGIVATWLLEHGSCLGIFPTSLPSVPTTLSGGAGAVLDWVPGAGLAWAFLEVSGPPLLSCPSVFSLVGTSSSNCALCWRTHSHAVCLGNMWGALLCAPHHMEGTRTWLASWLARAGAWESLCYFHSSVLSLYCAGGFCAGSKADGLLHSGTYFVSCFCDPALYQTSFLVCSLLPLTT